MIQIFERISDAGLTIEGFKQLSNNRDLTCHLFQHNSKTIIDLPPASRLIRCPNHRAIYGSYIQTHCFDIHILMPQTSVSLNRMAYCVQRWIKFSNYFPIPCTSCAAKRCSFGKDGMRCFPYILLLMPSFRQGVQECRMD